nr:trehalase family glycosidase [Saprospiraceae bacterium]
MQKPYYRVLSEVFLRAIDENISTDGKLIADADPLFAIQLIEANYQKYKENDDFNFKDFFLTHFKLGTNQNQSFYSDSKVSLDQHIKNLWDILGRNADSSNPNDSLIPLPYPYIVPGGRFKEIYYWDSYFTMLGLAVHKKISAIESMVNNFA